MAVDEIGLPRFMGSSPVQWIDHAERYFHHFDISDKYERFNYVMAAFDDESFYWFNGWFRNDYLTWNDFTIAMCNKFSDKFSMSEKSSLHLKCHSIEDKMGLLSKQLEASEKYKSDYLKRYEDAINDKNKLTQDYMNRVTNLQKSSSSLDERCSSLSKTMEATKHIPLEWKRKYDVSVREAKSALEKAAAVQDRSSKQTQHRKDVFRAEFAGTLAYKEAELKERVSQLENAEQRLTILSLQLKTAESKINNYDVDISSLKSQIKELMERSESASAKAQSYEREAKILEQEKLHLEQKYQSEFDRFEEVQERCRNTEKETKRATQLADTARAEAVTAQKEKSEIQRLAGERLTEIARPKRRIENLERQTEDLAGVRSGSHDNPVGQGHPLRNSNKWTIWDNLKGSMGLGTVVGLGHGVEQKILQGKGSRVATAPNPLVLVVSSDLISFMFAEFEGLLALVFAFQQPPKFAMFEQQFSMSTVICVFKMDDRHLGRIGGTLLIKQGDPVPTHHSWVVHGQGRPPEDALEEAFTWMSSQLAS